MNVRLSEVARKQAVDQGLIPDFDCEQLLVEYVQQSAIITHELGNRRYGSFVFFIDGDELLSVNAIEPVCTICKGTRKETAFEACEQCDGGGCDRCANYGGFLNHITCQNCKETTQ